MLIAHNVISSEAYSSRYKGFVGELAFSAWLETKSLERKVFNGGYFLPAKYKNSSLKNPIYFTVSRSNPADYIPIYQAISKLRCHKMYFIQWGGEIPIEKWNIEDIMGIKSPLPVPELSTYIFDENSNSFHQTTLKKMLDHYKDKPRKDYIKIDLDTKNDFINNLSQFSFINLLELYTQRLIFDGYIGYQKVHGIPSDIDLIIQAKNKKDIVFLEIKEKDLSKRNPKGFGMDTGRIQEIESISQNTQSSFYYIVRQIDDQQNRNFLNWRYIDIHEFKKNLGTNLIQGGTGMGLKNGKYPTQICPEKHFKKF